VRQALGYDQINLFGHSYGATAAQYYLRQHEDHVRTVILSGGSLLDIPVFERWTVSGQRALDQLFDRCAADPACRAAYPDLRQEFAGLLDRLEQQPVSQKFTNPADQQPGTVTFTRDYFAEIVRVITLEEKNAVGLPRAIHRAYALDDWTDFTRAAYTYGAGDWGPQMMEHVIRCGEKWAAFTPREVARLGAGTYLEGWYNQLAASHAFACELTPKGEMPEGTSDQPHSQVPVLLLIGDADPQNPPENVAGYQELWPNSLLVVEPYQGHWLSDFNEIMCRWSIETQFIQEGSVQGLDTSCMKTVQPLPFPTSN
jgi:pimeloyl-ACP methyl ester carboxylesterase